MKNYFSKEEIRVLKIEDSFYPESLRKIQYPPKRLYFRGKFPRNGIFFAIVGTRRCSDYGKEIAFSFAKTLAEKGVIVVSGMARGIDTFSHKGAIEGGGKTIAVLGTGVDEKSIYPKENIPLARKILESGGCLISEYPPGTPGRKENFPKRNRIISGLSKGVLIVEAKLKSGALITANLAKKQKREVFAVPGPVHSLNSKGPHSLIKKGARLTETVEDILKFLNVSSRKRGREVTGKTLEERLIIEVLKNGCLSVEEIIERSKLNPQQVSITLSLLEIESRVKSLGGNIYTLLN